MSARRIVERTLAGLEETGKGIILLHDLKPATAAALPALLAALKEKGYRLVHVVPKQSFEPNAAFTAEVAEVIEKRRRKLAGTDGKPVTVANANVDQTGSVRPLRHLRKAKVGKTREKTSSIKKPEGKGQTKREKSGKAQQVINGPFRRV